MPMEMQPFNSTMESQIISRSEITQFMTGLGSLNVDNNNYLLHTPVLIANESTMTAAGLYGSPGVAAAGAPLFILLFPLLIIIWLIIFGVIVILLVLLKVRMRRMDSRTRIDII